MRLKIGIINQLDYLNNFMHMPNIIIFMLIYITNFISFPASNLHKYIINKYNFYLSHLVI